jgi:glucan phosphoethanolaminetransferase (alkaline phosphatase superfamily)
MVFQAQSTWRESRRQEAVDYSSIPDLNRIAPDLQEREIYVLVIGETARADSWYADLELNHYENIKSTRSVAFSNAYSQANFTDGSLQLLMTGASSYQESDRQAPLPLVLKASDCQTIWISNNKAYRYASQADYSVVTDQSTSTPLVKRYDHALLPAIHRAITQSEQRSCLIVHLLGSHFSYHNRYGNSFMQKAVDIEDYEDKYSAGHVAALRNAYDNSIHATNDLLEQNIDSVKKQSATAMVMYTADHGENIYDDERGLFQHIMNPPSKYEVAVPFFIWVSDRFISNFPDKWSNLHANADRPISNKQVLPTFVDLLGVDYDVTHLDSSLFADYPIDAERYVLAPDMRLLSESDIR